MSVLWIALAYTAAAAAMDGPAHRLVYPLVGDGYPLTGRRRLMAGLFGPFVIAGIWLWRVPMIVLILLAVPGPRR